MNTPERSLSRLFARSITWCPFPNLPWRLSSKSCGRTFMRRVRTTRQRPCRSIERRHGSGFAWPLLATPRTTRHEPSSTRSARQRMTEPRFLVVRLGSLGDIVHTFPAVAGLGESFPKAEIIWLTHPRWKVLVESSELATEIWEIETRSYNSVRGILARIRNRQFTLAVDYQ